MTSWRRSRPPATVIWCPLRRAENAHTLPATSVARPKDATPAHHRAAFPPADRELPAAGCPAARLVPRTEATMPALPLRDCSCRQEHVLTHVQFRPAAPLPDTTKPGYTSSPSAGGGALVASWARRLSQLRSGGTVMSCMAP